ncbi:MAG TPA: META domain-containing protein [Patescibacteria group bacterium]|nr:META domain-containing protein [Patescibacteria group bacterium]
MKHSILLIFLILTFTSCSQPDQASNELYNQEWHLEIFEEVAGLPASAHQVPQDERLILVLNDTAATGIADCNSFQGNYKLEGERISFSNIAVTEMDCGDNSLGAQFLQALRTSEKFSVRDGTLRIRYNKGKQLVFRKD